MVDFSILCKCMPTKPDVLEERMNNLIEQNSKDHKEILSRIDSLVGQLEGNYIPKARFEPIEKIVYGLVGLLLTAFGVAVIKLVSTHGVL
jgi:hypothetical protein